MAKEIILREAQFVKESDQFDELEIDFMGGEPFMNFSLIKEIVEWLETGVIDVPWICFATTNATLLTIYISSPGRNVDIAVELFNFLKLLGCKIRTVNISCVNSTEIIFSPCRH